MAIPLLEGCELAGKDVTADALLTQRALASYLVERQAHYHFTVKGNQARLQRDIALLFERRGAADFVEVSPPDHGRIETRRIWCSSALNAYIDFPHVAQVFLIERETIEKKTGKQTCEIALGITSRTPLEASPQRVLTVNRGHWAIESVHYIIDWNYDEDRSRIRTGFGPENITRLRRFAVGIRKSFQKPAQSIAQMMRALCFRSRLVLDYLRMTKKSTTASCGRREQIYREFASDADCFRPTIVVLPAALGTGPRKPGTGNRLFTRRIR
jgi:predicted transposase YbfD/YdcC